MAILIVLLWSVGLVMDDLDKGPFRLMVFNGHKWLGVTVFWLIFYRAFLRIKKQVPPFSDSNTLWQTTATKIVHGSFYLLMILIPISGWIMNSYKGHPLTYFGWFDIPNPFTPDKEVGHLWKEIHEFLANSLMVLVGIHVLAVLKHHLWDKQDVLRRMRPRQKWPKRYRH